MITKYKTGSYSKLIEVVEIDRETEQTVFYTEVERDGSKHKHSERKQSQYYNYFDTFDEAKHYILSKKESEIMAYEKALAGLKADLEIIVKLEQST